MLFKQIRELTLGEYGGNPGQATPNNRRRNAPIEMKSKEKQSEENHLGDRRDRSENKKASS